MRALTPKLADLLDKGLASHKAGDIDAALKVYARILKKRPAQPEALWLKGVAMLDLGNPESAVKAISRAVKGRPDDAAILNDLGMAQEAAGQFGAARASFRQALQLNPESYAVQVNIARCALADGDAANALQAVDRALAAQASYCVGHNVRGLALKALGRRDEALVAFAAALSQEPDNTEVLFNKGDLLRELGDDTNARLTLERATFIAATGSTDWIKATMTLGLLSATAGHVDVARENYDAVLSFLPTHVETLVNRGELSQTQGNLSEAEADFNSALETDNACAAARFNLSRIHLQRQKWSEGWDGYESRWEMPDFVTESRSRGVVAWDGSVSPGLKLLVWGEQGLGDQILFSSQIPDLLQKGLNPALEVDPRLAPLMQRSFPDLEVCAYDCMDSAAQSLIDSQVPMGSLGRVVRRSESDFGKASPFLQAEPNLSQALRERYSELAKGRKIVGIAWHSINPSFGAQKSLSLDSWGPLLSQHAEAFFVSLQYGDIRNAVQNASDASGADIFVDAQVDPISDFDAAAAQVAAMDLIVSTSNTAVHLAGALGKPTWVMVPHVPEWRWGLQGETVPWYESVRVFRQPKQGDWEPVLTDVDGELRRFLSTQ